MTDARLFLCPRAEGGETRGTLRPGEAPPAGKRCGPAAWGGKAPHLPCGFGRILRSPLGQRPVFSEAHGSGRQRRARQKEGFRHGSGPRKESVCPGEDTLYPEACCVFQALRSCERFLMHGKEKGVREGLFHEPHIRMGTRFSSLRAGNCAGKGGIGPTSAPAASAAGTSIPPLFLFLSHFPLPALPAGQGAGSSRPCRGRGAVAGGAPGRRPEHGRPLCAVPRLKPEAKETVPGRGRWSGGLGGRAAGGVPPGQRGPGFFCLLPALSRAFFRKRGRGHFPFSESGLCSEKKEFAHEHADTPADCCRAG